MKAGPTSSHLSPPPHLCTKVLPRLVALWCLKSPRLLLPLPAWAGTAGVTDRTLYFLLWRPSCDHQTDSAYPHGISLAGARQTMLSCCCSSARPPPPSQ